MARVNENAEGEAAAAPSLKWGVDQVLQDSRANYQTLYLDDDLDQFLASLFYVKGVVYSRSQLRDIAFTIKAVIGNMDIRDVQRRTGENLPDDTERG